MRNLSYIKYVVIALVAGAIVYFTMDYQRSKRQNGRTTENQRQTKQYDSLRFSAPVLNDDEINQYIRDNKELLAVIKESKIELKRVNTVLLHALKYRDTIMATTNVSPIIQAVNSQKDLTVFVLDSTKCLIIKGNIKLENNQLSFNITDRVFNTKTTAVGYWERRLWKCFWFKTRFLGKIQSTVKVVDECGESKTIVVQKTKD